MEELTKILESAEMLFRKYGIRSVTMSDIAGHLGISKKTLYQFITNKNDLIERIMLHYISGEKAMCLQISETALDALDEMLKIGMQVQRNIDDMNPSLMFDLRKYHYPIWQKFEEYRKDFILSLMISNLERGQQEEIYREDMSVDIISRIHIGTIYIFTDEELLPPDEFPRGLVHREFVLYHLYGIVSEKGRELMKGYLQLLQNKTKI